MRLYLTLLLATLTLSSAFAQQQADPAAARLRETLKNTMLQLRSAQTDLATQQAAVSTLEAEKKTLEEKVALLTKQAIADKDFNDKTLADLRTKSEAQSAQIAAKTAAIEKWKVALSKATTFGEKTEASRSKLAAQVIVLNRVVADQKLKNAEMYKIGNEILTRYEKFGLGDALTAREPFVGLTRVKFENLIQDYSDKVADQKIKP